MESEDWAIVIDLETLGLRADTVILSCGVVLVDLNGNQSFEELVESGVQVYLDQTVQKCWGRTTTPLTLQWWEDQEINNPDACYCLDPVDSFVNHPTELMEIIKNHWSSMDLKNLKWFARNPVFDFSILNDLCIYCEIDTAWRYGMVRCVKTYIEMTGQIYKIKPENYIPHNSLHDAAKDALLLRLNKDKAV
jgi:hypothetical protein